MFGSSATYPRRATNVLARPRLGPLRSYLRPRNFGAGASDMPATRSRKAKGRKPNGSHKMDPLKKRTPDYTDIAYREAVSRLRYLLAESYSPYASRSNLHQVHISKVEESGDETEGSVVVSERARPIPMPYRAPIYNAKRTPYVDSLPRLTHAHTGSTLNVPGAESMVKGTESGQPPPELMAFIERQEEYIEQLEKESQYCRDELSNLLGKVKEVINENEGLHEKEKTGLLKSVFNCFESEDDENQEMDDGKVRDRKPMKIKKKRLEGPAIVFESRISELEAQLTQTKIDLRKALEEADLYKKKCNEGQTYSSPEGFSSLPTASEQSLRQQVDALQREKSELNDNMAKLQTALAQFRDKEADASNKVKRSLDVVDQAQFEKQQSEGEVRRLKDDLDRQHEKLQQLLQDQGRKLQDERIQAERRYAQQIDQLTSDLTLQWDLTSKLQLELEKQRRSESDTRRELQQKSCTVDELKKELQTKIAGLQGEIMQAAAEKGSVEQELSSSRLAVERTERESRQEIARLQAEVTALRQRLDRADADLMHSRRENLRLSEQVSSLEREVNIAKMLRDTKDKNSKDGLTPNSPSKSAQREKEISSMIHDMEAKHVQTVAELEGMILAQNAVMDKLKDECHALTERLEDSSARHKEEKASLKSDNAMLLEKLAKVWENCKQLYKQDGLSMSPDSFTYQQEMSNTQQNQSRRFSTSPIPNNSNMLSAIPNNSNMLSPSRRPSTGQSPRYAATLSPRDTPRLNGVDTSSPKLTERSRSTTPRPSRFLRVMSPSPPHDNTRTREPIAHRKLTLEDLATDSEVSSD